MSSNASNEDKQNKGTCRDYERGVCNRGNRCKFFHPEGVSQPDQKLPICKDFQNKGCDRMKCKFLHITQEEEADYNNTGILPAHGGRSDKVRALMGSLGGGGLGGNKFQAGVGTVGGDVCKDFLNKICQRGNRCKFRHISEREYQLEQQLEAVSYGTAMGATMYGKRRRDDFSDIGVMGDSRRLVDENELLRRKITDLQRQVVDLRQMNDTLYDQNTRYRNQLRGITASQPTSDPYLNKAYSASSMSVAATSYDGYTKF